MIETSYTSSRTPTHDTVMLLLLTEVCGVFNDWLNAYSWQNRIQHVIVKKTRQDVTPYFCFIPAWHFNVLITRKCTMNSTLEILNKYFSWINTNKYQSLIHINLSFQLKKCWAQSFAIGDASLKSWVNRESQDSFLQLYLFTQEQMKVICVLGTHKHFLISKTSWIFSILMFQVIIFNNRNQL